MTTKLNIRSLAAIAVAVFLIVLLVVWGIMCTFAAELKTIEQ